MRNRIYFRIAGIINLFTALLHTIGGQLDLVNPLIDSNLELQQKGEWIGAFHIVTILLFLTSYAILKAGFGHQKSSDLPLLKSISLLYILSGLPFLFVSIWYSIFAPQWILLMPIGALLYLGLKSVKG